MGIVVDTTDPDLAYSALSTLYNVRRFRVPGPRFSVFVSREQVGPMGLHHLNLGMSGRIDAVPLGPVRLIHLISGNATYHRRRRSTDYGPGDVYLSTRPEIPVEADVETADMEIAVLDPRILSQVADTAPGRSSKAIELTSCEPITPRHAARWLTTFRYVRDELSTPLAGDGPLLASWGARLVAAATLSTFPNTSVAEDSRRDRRDAHTETLRRAMQFIDENADVDISIADIATGSYASIRSVQLAFRRHLDTPPLQHLRDVRLDRAHHELAAADPAHDSVAEIAHRWGFSNLSRFARHHQAAYGVLPHHTLHERWTTN